MSTESPTQESLTREPLTRGVDHVGLTVNDLAASRAFFTDCLNFKLIGERESYPAVFVSDGVTMITLWQVSDPATAVGFDRRNNIGLHHLAFKVASEADLRSVFDKISHWPGVAVEFAPELSGKGPKLHCMFAEPSGNRIEVAFDPR